MYDAGYGEEEFVTLHRVFASRVSRTDTFRANTLIIGERFRSVSDSRISGALIGYTNLEEWTAVRMLRMEKGTSTDSYRVAIPTPTTDLFEVRDRAPFRELKLVAGVQSAQGVTNFSAQMRAFFDCAFQHPVQLREAQGIVGQLGNLLSLLQHSRDSHPSSCSARQRCETSQPRPSGQTRIAHSRDSISSWRQRTAPEEVLNRRDV
jgi:hypothetical protein